MPKNQIDKDEMICYVLKLKHQVDSDDGFPGEKEIAQKISEQSTGQDTKSIGYNKQVFGTRFKPPQMGVLKLG